MKNVLTLIFLFIINISFSQVLLSADGKGNTYTLINSVFANPNRNVIETPDCNHANFGRHIDEVFDKELKKFVFRFHIHVSPDNDRCKKYDRQRNEIKTYKDSPENLKATKGETIEYKWKFKLSKDFKPSKNFTHIHQIKSVGGDYASMPMITFSARKKDPNKLELRYTSTDNQKTIKDAPLDLFTGNWVQVKEVISYGDVGSYSMEIKNVITNKLLFYYSNNVMDTWQTAAIFARPKWGIYRSLKQKQDLKDEIIKFADFSIKEINTSKEVKELNKKSPDLILLPNPKTNKIEFEPVKNYDYNTIEFYDNSSNRINVKKKFRRNKLDISNFNQGLYFIVFKKNKMTTQVLKFYKY